MKNIHILPTDKPSRLILQTNNKLRLSVFSFKGQIASGVTQNIYITSDEEIKGSDWVKNISFEEPIFKLDGKGITYVTLVPHLKFNKIILTTDQDLIKDGVQAIPDEFLEWFVRNPSCEEIEVKSEILYEHKDTYRPYPSDCKNLSKTKVNYYLSIIPKEERKKNFYCGDEVDYGDQCSEQCVQCVNATGVDYGYLPHEDPKPFKHEIKSIPKEEIVGKRLEKYSERFDNDKSPIGNPETWGKRLVDETIEEAFDRIYNSIDFTEFDFASFKLGVKWEQERNK